METKSPFFLYLIGTSGSGKSTIGTYLNRYFSQHNNTKVQFIDGDELRERFGNMFGYTKEERLRCNQAARVVVQYLLENDISVILTGVVAYEEMRQKIRNQFGNNYIQCYIKCSFEECCRRDPKGYYKKYKQGQMKNLNGADDPYEKPLYNEIVVDTEKLTVEESASKILNFLEQWKKNRSTNS